MSVKGEKPTQPSVEFFHNYTKLTMLAIKADVGKYNINSAKKLSSMGIEPGNSCDPP